MPHNLTLLGQRFHRLTLVAPCCRLTKEHRYNAKHKAWACVCDCGKRSVVRECDLTAEKVRSCGCLQKESAGQKSVKHGLTGSLTYTRWVAMLSRCYNVKQPSYANYGGRGIFVCDRWRNSFEAFLEDMGECPKRYTLDRIDNNGIYEPGNCRWATQADQSRNHRRNRNISYLGRTQCLQDWAAEMGLRADTISCRIDNGWSLERALTTPARHRNPNGFPQQRNRQVKR